MLSKLIDKHFFTTPSHPINLAIFRIVFAATLFSQISWRKLLFYANMPETLRFAPEGLGWLLPYVPISPDYAAYGAYLFYLFSFTLLIGLFTRTSALLVALTAFYALGIEKFFGNVSHAHHHIVPFCLILALSPSGDALSLDSVAKGWKSAFRGQDYLPPELSAAYTLPIRLIWIMIGIFYFFPGYWKLKASGLDWALGDNMKYQLHGKWFWMDWTPFFRIDQHPFLYKISGLLTLAFETLFIFLLFVPALRYLPIIIGLFFHTMTAIFMRITFWSLAFSYVAFFNWHHIFQRVGNFVFKRKLYLISHPGSRKNLILVNTVKALDVFDCVHFLYEPENNAASTAKEALFYGVLGNRRVQGAKLYLALLARVPVLIFLLPAILAIPRRYDSNLSAPLPAKTAPASIFIGSREMLRFGVFGACLIAVHLYLGFSHTKDAWPFACFPTFRETRGAHKKVLEIAFFDAQEQQIASARLKPPSSGGKAIRAMIARIIKTDDDALRKMRLYSLLTHYAAQEPQLEKTAKVKVFETTFVTDPDAQPKLPVKRIMKEEITL